jgi:hypothetical protein
MTEHKKAVELNPNSAFANFNLASLYFGSRQYDLAWKHLRLAEKLGMSTQHVNWLTNQLRKVSSEAQGSTGGRYRKFYLRCKTCQTEFPLPMWSRDVNVEKRANQRSTALYFACPKGHMHQYEMRDCYFKD